MNTTCTACGHQFETQLAPGLKGACPKCLADFLAPTTPAAPRVEEPDVVPSGSRIGGVEVLEVLGRGGMGVVYKARHPGLDRMVALKLLAPRLASDPGFVERFNREARTLAALDSPRIVRVHDFGQDDGRCFLVMEYVDGT